MPSPRKVILFAYYYLPDNTSGVQRAVRIAKYLPEFGFDPIVIAGTRGGIATLPNVEHVPRDGHYAPRHRVTMARFLQRIAPYNECLEWASHALNEAKRVKAQEPIHAVISTSPPLATHLAAMALKKRHGLIWVADFRDPLYGNPGRSRRWATPYDKAVERTIFASADHVVAVTDTVAAEWAARYPRLQSKFRTIWNGFDPEEILPVVPIPPRERRELAHVGVLYTQRHPYLLVIALDRLIRRGLIDPQSVRLRLVGPIQDREHFESNPACVSLRKQDVLSIDSELIPRRQANQLIASSDYLLLIDIVNASQVGYTVPAKLYDYILVGRPILALTDRNSPVDRILACCGVPFTCLYNDDPESEIDNKLVRFFKMASDSVNPSAWFMENFDGRRQVKALADLLDNDRCP